MHFWHILATMKVYSRLECSYLKHVILVVTGILEVGYTQLTSVEDDVLTGLSATWQLRLRQRGAKEPTDVEKMELAWWRGRVHKYCV